MKLFNIEIFDRTYGYKDSTQIESFDYSVDYLSIDENELSLPQNISADTGDYIFITSLTSQEEISGIISSVKIQKEVSKVRFKPFLNWLNVELRNVDITTDLETWLKNIIEGLYVNNIDSAQNIPHLSIQTTSETEGSYLMEGTTFNLFNCITELFKTYGIVLRFDVVSVAGNIVLYIGKNNAQQVVIESDLPNIINKNIVLKTSSIDSFNKVKIFNTHEGTVNEVIYYRDTSGSITTTPSERILPVVYKETTIDCISEEFDDKALEKATDILAVTDLDNLIELQMLEEDSLIEPKNMSIGQKVQIINEGNAYFSVLTGYKQRDGLITLVFGAIRLELTKILKRRLNNGN